MSWQPPYWAHPPPSSDKWDLIEIKQGNVITTHSLNQKCITFGRGYGPHSSGMPKISILTAHESCSRLHARIAFDSRGIPWLRDLGSGNGTFVNGRGLPREACGKLEETPDDLDQRRGDGDNAKVAGGRGVVIYPGDAIRFGASTRMYCIEGPEEYERGGLKTKGTGVKISAAKTKMNAVDSRAVTVSDVEKEVEEPSEAKENEGCSWGMDDDLPPEHDETSDGNPSIGAEASLSIESFFSNPGQHSIPSSLYKLYQTYQTKLHKIESITIESSRITQKERMGIELTEGQTKQLEKNEARIKTLENEIAGVKERLAEGIQSITGKNVAGRGAKRNQPGSNEYGQEDEDVDDFYDRTSDVGFGSKRQRKEESEAETEESLIAKWKSLHASRVRQSQIVSQALQKCKQLETEVETLKAQEEDEDIFFVQNDLTLATENSTKANTLLEEIEKEMDQTERLLQIVNPKLNSDRETGWIGFGSAESAGQSEMGLNKQAVEIGNKPAPDSRSSPVREDETMMMPPPDAPTMQPPMIPLPSELSTPMDSTMPPPENVLNSTFSAVADETPALSRQKVIRPVRPVRGDIESSEVNSDVEHSMAPPPPPKRRILGPSRPPPGVGNSSDPLPSRPSQSSRPTQRSQAVQSTLAALQHAVNVRPDNSNSNSNQKNALSQSSKPQELKPFDPRKDEWKAPADQDGSGRTSLNDKFRGRY